MEIKVNNLINNTKLILYINSNDTVNDIKKLSNPSIFFQWFQVNCGIGFVLAALYRISLKMQQRTQI